LKHIRILFESLIMALGFGLVLITLSGSTRTWAVWLSLLSVGFYTASQYLGEDD
jgi:hypothetical protein